MYIGRRCDSNILKIKKKCIIINFPIIHFDHKYDKIYCLSTLNVKKIWKHFQRKHSMNSSIIYATNLSDNTNKLYPRQTAISENRLLP